MDQKQQAKSLSVLKKFRIIFGSVRHHFSMVEVQCGVSGSQIWVLNEVCKEPNIGVSEVASRLSIHQSTCSQLVEKLAKKNLLRKIRGLEDQRRVGLQLTPEGQAILNKAPGPAEGLLPKALLGMSRKKLSELETILDELIVKLEETDSSYADRPLSDL